MAKYFDFQCDYTANTEKINIQNNFLWSFEHKSAETKIDSFDHKCLSNPLDRNMINWLYQKTNKRTSSRPNPIHNCHCFHRVPMVWCCTRSITNLLKIYYVQQKAGQLQKSEKKQKKTECNYVSSRIDDNYIEHSIHRFDAHTDLATKFSTMMTISQFIWIVVEAVSVSLYTVWQIERKVEAIESTTMMTTTKGYEAILYLIPF